MCLNCGCKMPNDDMGDSNNITVDDIKKSVQTDAAKGMTADQALQELVSTWNQKASDEDKNFKAE